MDNSQETTGVQNVVIENVTPDSMKVNVNGEVKEIKNTLDELKLLFQGLNVDNFKSGDKIYNIGSITNAVFSAEIGKKTFNMYLCRKLTEAIRDYSPDARKLLEKLIKDTDKANWETKQSYRNLALPYIINGFVGVLSIFLGKLISSGNTSFSSKNAKDYLEVCIATTKRTLQLLAYSFISKLWDHKKNNECELSTDQLSSLDKNFFNIERELDIIENLDLFKTLINIFDEQNIEYPFSEFNKDCLKDDSNFIKACKNLANIHSKLDSGEYEFSIAFEAENELTVFLTTLSFFAKYKMVSVKDISYEEVRNENAQYLLSYTFLGVDNDSNIKKPNSPKYRYDSRPISSNAVIIYKSNYQEGLNLFPLIIDKNALILDKEKKKSTEVKICFFIYLNEDEKKLIYSDIAQISSAKNDNANDYSDLSQVEIQYNEKVENELKNANTDNDITELKEDVNKYNELQLNTIYKIFENAKKELMK